MCDTPLIIPKYPGPKELPGPELSEKKRFLKVIQVRSISPCLIGSHNFNYLFQRYHSDKNLASVYGEEWAVMAEEISKALGACYNIIKGVD